MSTNIKYSLLLTLAVAALTGPAAAVAKPVYEPGDVPRTNHVQAFGTGSAASHYTPQALYAMGARMQAEAEAYAGSSSSIRHAGEVLQSMGDNWAADEAFSKARAMEAQGTARAQESQGTVSSGSAPVGDRWGSDAYQSAQSAPVGDRWGSDAYQRAQSTSGGVTASSNDSGRDVLSYVLIALGILLATIAALFGFSQLRGRGSEPRIALP